MLHIDRHVDEHRPRPTSSGDIKGFLENLRNIRSVFNYVAVFGKRFRCAGDVRLLENVTSEQIAAHLPCDHHQGNGIHMCRGDAGDQVGSAGTGGGNTYADSAGNAGIPTGGMSSILFGTHEYMVYSAADKAVVKRTYGSTRGNQTRWLHLQAANILPWRLRRSSSVIISFILE